MRPMHAKTTHKEAQLTLIPNDESGTPRGHVNAELLFPLLASPNYAPWSRSQSAETSFLRATERADEMVNG
uniref:Uncharacterized protein n=1 Tax=Steinernema glaseri TaxID=37863 RepID=A0A1I7Y182_9BILA